MPESATKLPTAAGEIGLYCKTPAGVGMQPELYFQRQSGIADAGFPMTQRVGTSPGWTYLPSGLKMIWGTGSTAGASPATKVTTYNSTAGGGLDSFPGFTTFAIPFVTRARTTAAVTTNLVYILTTYTTTSFTTVSSDGTSGTQFVWYAIGL